MPGTSVKSGAIEGRAATLMLAPGACRRTSAIAGSAITASPSQFGANTISRLLALCACATFPVSMNQTRGGRAVPPDPLLSVVMPVFNERTTVEAIIRRVLAVPLRIELIVVDDGSTDGSGEILDELQHDAELHAVPPAERGQGRGAPTRIRRRDRRPGRDPGRRSRVLAGRVSRISSISFCNGHADVVYGSRFLGRHRVFLFTHYLGNRVVTLATNMLYNTMLTDMETCYKVMRVDVLRSFTLESNGFGIEPELTAKIFKRGYRVYEIPITYAGRGYDEGKKITWVAGLVALWVLLKYRFTGMMKIALLQINPTVGDLERQRAPDRRRRPRGGRARRRPGGHPGAGARRLPAARSAAQRRLRQAQLGSAARRWRASSTACRRCWSACRSRTLPTRDGRCSTRRRSPAAARSISVFARRCCPPTTSSTRTATSSRSTERRS